MAYNTDTCIGTGIAYDGILYSVSAPPASSAFTRLCLRGPVAK